MPIVIGKNVNFLLTKFTKAGQIYPRLRTPDLKPVEFYAKGLSFVDLKWERFGEAWCSID